MMMMIMMMMMYIQMVIMIIVIVVMTGSARYDDVFMSLASDAPYRLKLPYTSMRIRSDACYAYTLS